MYSGTTLERYLQDKKTMGSSNYLGKARHSAKTVTGHLTGDKENFHGKNKKSKVRRNQPKMSDYGIKKRLPDYTEIAYKEAVSRLRFFLSESYASSNASRSSKMGGASIKNLDESGDEAYDIVPKSKYPLSLYTGLRPYNPIYLPPPKIAKRYPFYSRENIRTYVNSEPTLQVHTSTQDTINVTNVEPSNLGKSNTTDTELMGFIQKQEEYIEQLERESSYCREELNNLLGKVKEVISENESLHEKQKSQLLASVMDRRSGVISESDENDGDSTGLESDAKYTSLKKKPHIRSSSHLEGPNIVFESKISELEAQLAQSNIDLKKLQEENHEIRNKLGDSMVDSPCLESFKRQIENLQRDKSSLEVQVAKLKSSLDDRKDIDSDIVSKMKRSADLAYQANYDKAQLEMEIRRLKDELERQQTRVRELLGEQTRRVMEERNAVERRYCSQVEQLTSDLTTHWDSATKLQLELERQKREETELKRELLQKNSQIEDLKLELKNKIASLQADIAQAHADRAAVEEELANARLMLERHQRQSKHDANRLNSEVQSVRQRLDRADADLVHSRRENLRLMEQIANMEKEMNLRNLRPSSPKEVAREKELSGKIMEMESKHAQTVSELETMVCSQNSLMEKLTTECHLLTSKLDDANQKHKQEMAALQNKLEQLSLRVQQNSTNFDSNNLITDHSSSIYKKPARYKSNDFESSDQNENQYTDKNKGGRGSISPESSTFEPHTKMSSKQSPLRQYSSNEANIQGNETFYKPFKQSENINDVRNRDTDQTKSEHTTPLAASRTYDNVEKHSVDNKQHLSNKEQSLFGEEQEMDYVSDNEREEYPMESNLEYDTNVNYQQYTDPNQQQINLAQTPNKDYSEQMQNYATVPAQYTNSPKQHTTPSKSYPDTSQHYEDSSQVYDDPSQQYIQPSQQYTEAQGHYAEQPQEYIQSSQGYIDPNQQYTNPTQQYAEMGQEYVDPSHQYDPSQQYIESTNEYGDPNIESYATDQQYTDVQYNQQYDNRNQNYENRDQVYDNRDQNYETNRRSEQYATEPSGQYTEQYNTNNQAYSNQSNQKKKPEKQ